MKLQWQKPELKSLGVARSQGCIECNLGYAFFIGCGAGHKDIEYCDHGSAHNNPNLG